MKIRKEDELFENTIFFLIRIFLSISLPESTDIISQIHFHVNVFRIAGILRDKVKIFRVFFFYPNLVVGITAINFNFHVIRNLNARLLLRYKRNSKGRRRSCRANKNDAPAALFEYYPKAPRVCT